MNDDLKPMSRHCFNASWQHKQIKKLTENLPSGHCIMMMDFSENYSCRHSQEIQAQHWSITQITIHPILVMAYSRQGDLMKFSFIFTTDDLKHDTCAVRLFVRKTMEQIRSLPYMERISVIHQVTDGCALQYKGKNSFIDISHSQEDNDALIIRNFYETSHGKGPCDGLGATAKAAAGKAVLQGAVIRNATEFHEFCVENLEQVADKSSGASASRQAQAEFSKRKFILVSREELEQVGHIVKQMISVTSKDNDNDQPSHSNDHTDDESGRLIM